MNRTKRHVQQHTMLAARVWLWTEQRHVQQHTMLAARVWLWTEQRDMFNSTCNSCSQCATVNRRRRHVQQHATLATNVWLWTDQRDVFKQNTCSQRMTMTINRTASIRLWTKQINPHFSCLPLKRFWRGRKTMAAIWVSARWGFWTVSSWAAWPLPALPGQQPSPTSRLCPCLCPCPCCPWGYLMGKCWCSWCPWLGELLLQWKAWSEAVNMGAAWWWWRRHPKPSCPRAFAHRRVLSPPPLPFFSHWQCQRCSGWRRAWATFVLSGLP